MCAGSLSKPPFRPNRGPYDEVSCQQRSRSDYREPNGERGHLADASKLTGQGVRQRHGSETDLEQYGARRRWSTPAKIRQMGQAPSENYEMDVGEAWSKAYA